jgi:hypothetical protein
VKKVWRQAQRAPRNGPQEASKCHLEQAQSERLTVVKPPGSLKLSCQYFSHVKAELDAYVVVWPGRVTVDPGAKLVTTEAGRLFERTVSSRS